ncbi:MAG: tripartite tricarboxylate transporter substrate binding protein [Pseudomonadota bacterium]
MANAPTSRRQFLGSAALLLTVPAIAQEAYPDKPVKVIVPFAPGGGADVVARLVFTKLSARLGHPFTIDNRGGAGGIVGTDAVAKARPDGYTLLLGQTGPNAINPALFAKIPYDPIADFAPVVQLTSYPYVIVVHPSVPVRNLHELITLSKEKPGFLNYGTAGTGSSGQLAAELFQRTTGVKLTHVPYKGAGPALADTVANVVAMTFGDMASATPLILSGRLRAIALTGTRRSPLLPDVPTVAESGFPGFEAAAWHGVYAPANTPPEIISKLNRELAQILAEPEVKERLRKDGIDTIGASPAAFGEYTRSEIKKWGTTVREANIKLE